MKPKCLERKFARSLLFKAFNSTPSILMTPEVAVSRPLIRLSKVVFPDPEAPTIQLNEPFSMVRLMSFNTSVFILVP